jgi:hypothetical protein
MLIDVTRLRHTLTHGDIACFRSRNTYNKVSIQQFRSRCFCIITDLDALANPDRTEARRYHYAITDRRGVAREATTAITSRGCPHGCAFCSHGLWQRRYIARSAAHVVAEAQDLRDLGYDAVHYYDDSLAIQPERLRAICEGLGALGMTWRAFVRADQMTLAVALAMAHGGCVEIGLGAGWMISDYEQLGIVYDRPWVRIDRFVEGLAVLRALDIADDDPRVNPNGGAIALGHPLGMTGARIAGSAAMELAAGQGRYAMATMCVGVGQGAALLLERV